MVVPFPKNPGVTIQGTLDGTAHNLPKFGVEVVMVSSQVPVSRSSYIDFVSTLPRSAAKERKWDIPHPEVGCRD